MSVDTETVLDLGTELAPYEDTEDGNQYFTHIVNPPNNLHIWQPGMSTKDLVFIARMDGIEITALCGYKFVPKRNPDKYPVCQPCVDIAGQLMRGKGE